jgi:hypothetical protein
MASDPGQGATHGIDVLEAAGEIVALIAPKDHSQIASMHETIARVAMRMR